MILPADASAEAIIIDGGGGAGRGGAAPRQRRPIPSAGSAMGVPPDRPLRGHDDRGGRRRGLTMLLDQLGPDDRVSIVTYAGSGRDRARADPASRRRRFRAVIEQLGAYGKDRRRRRYPPGYNLAEQKPRSQGRQPCHPGDRRRFQRWHHHDNELKGYIERERAKAVFLSCSVSAWAITTRADAGTAQNVPTAPAYIDNVNEPRKVLVEEATLTLFRDRQGREDPGRVCNPTSSARISPDRLMRRGCSTATIRQ